MDILEFFSKYQRFIIYSVPFLALATIFDRTFAVGIIFSVFLCAVTLAFLGKNKENTKTLRLLFLIIFLSHILAVLFIYYFNFQPFSNGSGDYVAYQQQAEEIAGRIRQGNFSLKGIDVPHYYPVIVGYLYAFTIPSMLLGQLLNAWLVALTIVFVYLIVRQIGGTEKQGFLTGLIAGFYPSLAFYGSLLLKDALVVLLSMAGLLLAIKTIKKFSWQSFLIFYIILTALIHFRFYIGYALMFGFIISWFLVSSFNVKKRIIYGIIIIFILGFSPQFLGFGYYGSQNFKTFLNPETITYYRETVYIPSAQPSDAQPSETQIQAPLPSETLPERRMSSIVIETGFENPFAFIKNSSLSFIYSLLGPFPWQMVRKRHLFTLLETLPWYFLFFFIIKGAIKSIKNQYKDILPLVIFAIFVIGVLSLYITNFGIITRIRIPVFLALLCLLPLGIPAGTIELFFKKIKIH
ncbi:MAG: glycosyltransferase family 39 protein [Candidatus Staskawiczbacteria bacterium]|nr:glycosyltransferase family 39 protein [Candidatus Staskawiczbacteria bacterium]